MRNFIKLLLLFGLSKSFGQEVSLAPYLGINYNWTLDEEESYQLSGSAQMPVYRKERHKVFASIRHDKYHYEKFEAAEKIPSEVSQTEGGLVHSINFDEQRNLTLRGSLGSTHSDLQNANTAVSYLLVATYTYPAENEDRWQIGLFSSNHGPLGFGVPLPGGSYLFRREKISGAIGLPISYLNWQLAPRWRWGLRAVFLNIATDLTYGETKTPQYFAELGQNYRTHTVSSDPEGVARVKYSSLFVKIGIRVPTRLGVVFESKWGYETRRELSSSEDAFGRPDQTIRLAEAWVGDASLKWLFP